MIAKTNLKRQAILLRKKGSTYGEILKQVPVAKSTLSLWLREVGLSKPQVQRITAKRRAAQLRGGAKRKEMRLEKSGNIFKKSIEEIGTISDRDLFLIGVALYWAEGTKQKVHNVSQGMQLINDDFELIKLYLKWLSLVGVSKQALVFDLYIHEASRMRKEEVIEYWTQKLSLPRDVTVNVYYKRHQTRGFRRKLASEYFGSMRVKVRSSTDLNRKIEGWVRGIISNCRFV